MRRLTFIILLTLLFVLSLNACTSSPAVTPPPVSIPIWQNVNLNDLPKTLNVSPDIPILSYQTTLYQLPKFFPSGISNIFESHKMMLGFGDMVTLINIFSDRVVLYRYDDPSLKYSGIANKALATDTEGNILAEAIVEKIDPGKGLIIIEVHYDKQGNLIFWCRSEIEFGLGDKVREFDQHGTKNSDYFFLWPVGSF